MKALTNISFLVMTLLILESCDFGDTNIDPTALADVNVNLILPAAQTQTARNLGSIGGRITGTIIQQFKGLEAQPETYNTYLIDENALDTYWRSGLYAAAMKDCYLIIEKGKAQSSPHYTGIAKVLMAYNLGIATTFWGDIPYSLAFDEENIQTPYDSQQEVYQSIISLLDEAIVELSGDAGDIVPSDDDLIFQGNAELWIKTANSLKARYWLHLIHRDPNAVDNILNTLQTEVLTLNVEDADFPFGQTQNEANPIAFFGEDRPDQLALGDFVLDLLEGSSDPRLDSYGSLSNGNYLIYQRDNLNLYWAQFDSPMPLITYSELLFIQAEANLRANNVIEANDNYMNAIEANLLKMGIAQQSISDFLSSIDQIDQGRTFEENLEILIEQKYISLFAHGSLEAWVDYRRTGLPALEVPSDANESFNPSKVIPRRYIYPISERNTNNQNLQIAIERQGGQLMDVDLWVFQP